MTKKATTSNATETPEGPGRAYETAPSGSANENGKASATVAGGDPVTSPVIGNPGENNPAAGNYDYGLAGAAAVGNPNQATAPLTSAEVLGGPGRTKVQTAVKYALNVRARVKGEYNGVKEANEVFENDRNLPTFPEDPNSWFEAAE